MQTSALSFIESAFSALERSVQDRKGELRNIQLATVSPEGRPGVRTVVLRDFQRAPAGAEMHSDARADKARDIAHAEAVTFVAWSGEDHLQLCFKGSARLHRDDDVSRDRWDKLSTKGRDTFGLRAEPGTPIADPEDQSHMPPEEQYLQFTVILVSLTSVDVLRLGPDGDQTRAHGLFTSSSIEAEWIGP